MIEDKIPVKFDRLKTIWHCADIHIRNVRRHREYREVFQRLYNEISKDTDNAIIVVAGDVVHAKLEMSPELIDLTFEFFKNLANILPTIIITGNHDCNLNNLSRLDVISPIVKNIDNPNLFYLKHSGIYDVADTKFVVMSVFQDPSDYLKAHQIEGNTKIALYHGTIQNAISQTGYRLHNEKVDKKTFEGYDIVLLGDVHKQQYLDSKNRIGFPGSLIQQNFGENTEHGILKWNVSERTSKFISIPNDYAYITLDIENGVMPDIESLYPKSRLRLMIKNTLSSRMTEIITSIREKYPGLQDINEIKIPDGSLVQDGININKIDIGNARDVSFQNVMIQEYLSRHYTIGNEVFKKIIDINNTLNTKLKPIGFRKNIVWKPKLFNFSNMFSYGEGNKIEFSKLKGIIGLFAPNRTGKSNFIESLCFTIFDKSPRALKSENVMNNKKDKFSAKFLYEIGDNEFCIKRHGSRKKIGGVFVKTDFSVRGTDGERKSLNEERRSSTNFAIRNYLGDYDSFTMTALVPQIDLHKGTNANLINMRQTDRKALLTRFLDLTVFQELYDLARYEMKTVEIKLENFEKRNFSKELAHANTQAKLLANKYKEKNNKKEEYEKLYKNIIKEINKLTGKLIKIDIEKTDIDGLNDDNDVYIKRIKESEQMVINRKENIKLFTQDVNNIKQKIDNIDDDIIDKYKLRQEIEKQRNDIQHNIDKYQIKIKTKREQLGTFSNLLFDPACGKCVQNKSVVEKRMETTDDILENETIVSTFEQQVQNFEEMLKATKSVHTDYELFLSLTQQLSEKNNKVSSEQTQLIIDEHTIDNLNHNLIDVIKNIELYHKNENDIKNNKEVQVVIDDWEIKLGVVENGINTITKEIMEIYSNIEVNKNNKQSIELEIQEIKNLEIQSAAYKYYMEAVEKDGVTFDLIVKTIPIIQHEVNNILAQMVDFQIDFNVNEVGKDIEPKIVYDGGDAWPIELVSGMERFISSIAIRVSLLSVSSLPRPNFLIIDEGFGSMDSENANNLYRLFDYLRSQFDFILIISHLDYIKDFADQLIELKNENGFSKIGGQ